MTKSNHNSLRGKPQSARELALQVLLKVESEQAYSGLALNAAFGQVELSRADTALATELVYGTIQRLNTIDYTLQSRVKGWPGKVQPWVKCLLRLSCYQLRWLDRIPAHAVVDEAVRIAKKRGHAGIAGLVNGVLRSLLREGADTPLPSNLKPVQRIALQHSHPEWLVERWIAAYGESQTELLCASNNESPHSSARVNRLKLTREQLLAQMTEAGIEAKPSELSLAGIVARKAGNLAHTVWHAKGELTIQDESSMLVAAALDPRPGMRVLDCCAAPGGKSTHIAELLSNEGIVLANDVHPHKEALIRQQAERLGLNNVQTMAADALELPVRLSGQAYDRVLLDAPCSGLGVIRRKPELKWNKSPAEIADLAQLQLRLLKAAQALVKPGGVLVYSTCTIAEEENEATVRNFLAEHPSFTLDPDWPVADLAPLRDAAVLPQPFAGMVQILPHHFGTDGFFIARLRNKR